MGRGDDLPGHFLRGSVWQMTIFTKAVPPVIAKVIMLHPPHLLQTAVARTVRPSLD